MGGRTNGPRTPLPATFRRLTASWAASLTGDGLRLIALPLLAVSIDRSPTAVAAVAVATTLPWLLVAVPAGALVDRLDPAMTMMLAHLTRVLLTVALTMAVITGQVSIGLLCALGFGITSAETVADGSAQTLLLRTVTPAALEQANARFVTVETISLDLAGPLLAGVLFVLAPWAPFALSAACFLVAAALARGMPRIPAVIVGNDRTDRGQGTLRSIRAGLVRLLADPVLRVLVVTVAVMNTAIAAAEAVLVLYGTGSLGMSEAFYPTLMVAYSIGILTAAFGVGRLVGRVRGGVLMMGALAAIGTCLIVMGAFPTVVVALITWAVMGIALGTWNVLSATRRQRRTPHSMIARVSSAFRVVAWGFMPLGGVFGGVIGSAYGVNSVYLVAGAAVLVFGLFVVRSFVRVEPGEQVEPADTTP